MSLCVLSKAYLHSQFSQVSLFASHSELSFILPFADPLSTYFVLEAYHLSTQLRPSPFQ